MILPIYVYGHPIIIIIVASFMKHLIGNEVLAST